MVAFERAACFPAHVAVMLGNGSFKVVEELLIGDRVQVGPSQFSEVFMLTHRESVGTHDFLYLYSAARNSPLILSPGHLRSINGEMKAARQSRRWDMIHLGDGTTTTITKIMRRRERGL